MNRSFLIASGIILGAASPALAQTCDMNALAQATEQCQLFKPGAEGVFGSKVEREKCLDYEYRRKADVGYVFYMDGDWFMRELKDCKKYYKI